MKKLSLAFAAILAASLATAASAAMYTDFENYKSFEAGGNPVFAFDDAGDYWAGEWNGGGTTADTVTVEIAEGAGYNGSKAVKIQSNGHENAGVYLFATADNGIVTDHTGAQYLRAWMDFSEVALRKGNFGVVDSTYSLFSTDEVDGAWECKFYYSADGATWTEMLHGDDGCFGTAQASDVLGLKGWFAFPVADFTIRSSANWEAYDDKTPSNPADVAGVYLFWDYDDATAAETPFYIDNLEFVADYKAFDYDASIGASEAPAAAAADTAADAPALQNLCLGATVTEVSGLETEGANTGDMAIDGDITTRWSSNTSDDAHIIIDIGSSPLPIGYVEIHWETACAQDYTIETSSDGTSWDVKATVTGNTAGTSPWSEDCVVVHEWTPATARYIKINCTKRNTEWGNSIWEIVARKAADTVESTAPAAYPASGTEVPADSVLINGTRIGNETGWGGNAAAGRDAAFDGDVNTFFDPLGTGDGWAGVDAGEQMILTKIVIHPRDGWADRFNGGTIEGANEEDFSDAVALFLSVEAASEVTFLDVTDEIESADNTGYRYFRYINYSNHGDVAEVELYGYAADGSNPTYGAAAAEAPAATEAPAAEAAPVEGEFDYAHFVASGNDPYATYDNAIDIDPEVVTWAQIKYRTITEKDSLDNTLTGQIYITPAAEPFIPVKWNHTGSWETIVVDLTSVSEKTTLASLWKDSLGLGFRFDVLESNRDAEANVADDPAVVLPDSAIDIAYIAFFETEDAAKAFDGVNGTPAAFLGAEDLLVYASGNNISAEVLTEVPVVEEAPVVEETPVVEEAPVEEPAAEEVAEEAPVEEVVEEVAEEVVEEEVVEEAPAVEEAPETFDFAVIAAIAAAISAAGYALSKKR